MDKLTWAKDWERSASSHPQALFPIPIRFCLPVALKGPALLNYKMSIKLVEQETLCLHLEKRVVERISKGIPTDKRPDLILWICHFPLFSLSGIQCPVIADSRKCPHSGPYGSN